MSKQPVKTIESKSTGVLNSTDHHQEDKQLNDEDHVDNKNTKLGNDLSLMNNSITMGNNESSSCSSVLKGKSKKKFQVNVVSSSKSDVKEKGLGETKTVDKEKELKKEESNVPLSKELKEDKVKCNGNIDSTSNSPQVNSDNSPFTKTKPKNKDNSVTKSISKPILSNIPTSTLFKDDLQTSSSIPSKLTFGSKFMEKKSSLISPSTRSGQRPRHYSFNGDERRSMRTRNQRTKSDSLCESKSQNFKSSTTPAVKTKSKKVKVVENKTPPTSDEDNVTTIKSKIDVEKIKVESKRDKEKANVMKLRERKMSRSIQKSAYPEEEESDGDISAIPKVDKELDETKKEPEEENVVATSPSGRFLKFDLSIGRGSFKAVFKGLDTETGVHVAWCELQVGVVVVLLTVCFPHE